MRICYTLILGVLCTYSAVFANNPAPIQISPNFEETSITSAHLLVDESKSLTISQAISATEYVAINPSELKVPEDQDVFWLKFKIQNNTSDWRNLVLEYKFWNYVDLYILDAQSNITTVKKTGQYVPIKERDMNLTDFQLVKVQLEPGETKTFITKLIIERTTLGYPQTFVTKIYDNERSESLLFENQTITAIFFGIYLIMFLYNFFIFLSTRDLNYVYYLLTILAFSGFLLNYSGLLFVGLSSLEWLPANRFTFDQINVVLIGVSSLIFVNRFLAIPGRYPFWSKVFQVLIAMVVIVPFMRFIVDIQTTILITNLVSILFITCIVIVTVRSFRAKYPSASFLIIGLGFSVAGTFVSLFSSMDLIPINSFTQHYALPLGSSIEMVLFSFALANKINVLRKENTQKQEKIIQQLKENEILNNKVNKELEEKVYIRTKEILSQKAVIEKERNKSENLLLNILPKTTVEELKNHGKSKPRYHPSATILFTDFKGFTKLSEKLSIEELHGQLDYCFRGFDQIVDQLGIEKIKTIGDAYMCASGIPDEDPEHAIKAVVAGFQMRDFIKKWQIELKKEGKPVWEIRVGIHSGPVISGVIGNKKFSYDIWGDSVNIASGIESAGMPGKINISQSTYFLVKNEFSFEPRGKISLKNKNAIEMYFVEPKSAAPIDKYLEFSEIKD